MISLDSGRYGPRTSSSLYNLLVDHIALFLHSCTEFGGAYKKPFFRSSLEYWDKELWFCVCRRIKNQIARLSLIEMASEQLLERSELRDMQRERERERRRMRDRQRRQSMSVEEKENHLARRRRNYQLRRQRVGTAQSDSQPEQTSISSIGEKITAIRNQAEVPISDVSVHCETAAKQGNGQIIVEGPRYEVGVEANTCKLDELPKRLRLNHIRHLARSLNNPVGGLIGGNDRIGSDVIMKENESAHYQPPKILRLTSVKRLARALNSITKQTSGHNPQCGMEEEQNVPRSKIQLICNEMSNYAQPVNLNVEDEQMSADG